MNEKNINDQNMIMDKFGELLVNYAFDSAWVNTNIIKRTSVNQMALKETSSLDSLTPQQKEELCRLMFVTIKESIYCFLDMFEAHHEFVKLILTHEGQEYNILDLSEKMGDEIAKIDGNSWIDRFSEFYNSEYCNKE